MQILLGEIKAMMTGDLIVSYLKATIEKIIVLISEVHELKGVDSLRKHKQRVNALTEKLEEKTKNTPYGALLLEYIKSENLEELNNYRNAVMHKKGSSKMQPHSYSGDKTFDDLPMIELLNFFHHHHRMNSLVLIGSLAMLTDNIMARKIELSGNDSKFKDELQKTMVEILTKIGQPIRL